MASTPKYGQSRLLIFHLAYYTSDGAFSYMWLKEQIMFYITET